MAMPGSPYFPPAKLWGVAIIEALNMLQSVQLKGWDEVESVHMVAEVMRRVFAYRAAYLAYPDYSNVPSLASLIHATPRKSPLPSILSALPPAKSSKLAILTTCGVAANTQQSRRGLLALAKGTSTTHFSVVDAAGNAFASTYTLNYSYGSHATSSAGFS